MSVGTKSAEKNCAMAMFTLVKVEKKGVELLFKSLYFRVSKEAEMGCIIISTSREAFRLKKNSAAQD